MYGVCSDCNPVFSGVFYGVYKKKFASGGPLRGGLNYERKQKKLNNNQMKYFMFEFYLMPALCVVCVYGFLSLCYALCAYLFMHI